MARPASSGLTPREAQIMEVLWTQGPCPADRIREALPDHPHDSTVRTLLRILETKSFVKHSIQGKAFIYRPAVKRANAERKAVNSLLQRFFGGSAEALVLRLIEDEKLTAVQLEQLKNASGNSDAGAIGDQRGLS
jgi:BlaI family transcriptional regulator, penicillinase repressor